MSPPLVGLGHRDSTSPNKRTHSLLVSLNSLIAIRNARCWLPPPASHFLAMNRSGRLFLESSHARRRIANGEANAAFWTFIGTRAMNQIRMMYAAREQCRISAKHDERESGSHLICPDFNGAVVTLKFSTYSSGTVCPLESMFPAPGFS